MKKIYLLFFVFFAITLNKSIAQTKFYSKAAATDFNNVNSWGTATDGTGSAPSSISNLDTFAVANGSLMSLSANGTVAKLLINAGTLTVATNTLTVSYVAGKNTVLSIASGARLNVNSGAVVLNGQFAMVSGAKFSQSGGTISVDGNDGGAAATSVAGNLVILYSVVASDLSLTGGSLIIVDPSYTTSYALYANCAVATNSTTGHTIQYGDGISTDAGGTNGFYTYLFPGSSFLILGNVIANGGTGTNRFVNTNNNIGILGNLTVNANAEYRLASATYLSGNLVNNGTLTTTSTLNFASYASAIVAAATSAQTVSGGGVFRNLTAAPTANFASVTVNNNSASGVSFTNGFSNIAAQPANSISMSGTLTFTTGKLGTASGSFILGVATPAVGTLSYTAGGFISGTTFGRWCTAATTGSAITAGADPATVTSRYPFVTASLAGRSAWITRTTPTAAGVIAITYVESAGTTSVNIVDGAYTVNTRSNDSWTPSLLSGTAAATSFTIAIVAPGVYVVSPPDANTRIVRASDVVGTHQAGTITPGGQRTALTSANLFGSTFYLGINLPACIAPGGLVAGSITATSASVSFTAPGSSFILEYGPVGFTPGTGATAGGVTSTVVTGASSPIAISGLTANTTYDVYVRQDCTGAGNGYSSNSVKVSFTTLCNAVTVPYSEGFESITTANTLPSCMSASDLGNKCKTYIAAATGTNSALFAHSGSKFAAVYYSPYPAAGWFFSAPINLTAGVSYNASVWYNTDGTAWTDAGIYYGTAANAGSMTNTIVSIANPVTNSIYNQMAGNFVPAVSGVYYIGIRANNVTVSPNYLTFDDLNVILTPSCTVPTGVTVGSITPTSVSVSFTGAGSAFIVEYGPVGFTPGTGATAGATGTVVTGAASPISLTGLTASTTYDVYVRRDCTGASNGYSSNSVKVTFTTACTNAALPYSEGFNTTGTAVFPLCFTQQFVSGTSNFTFQTSSTNPATTPFEGTRFVFWNSFSISAGNETRLVSRGITTTGTASVDVNFQWFNENNTSYNAGNYLLEGVQVQYSLDGTTWTDAGAFITRHDGSLTAGTGAWKSKTITLPAGAGNQATVYIGFKFHSSFGDNCSMDDLNVVASPLCPAPTAVAVGSITTTSASVTFTGAGTTYIAEIGATGFVPGTGATAGVGGTVFTGTSPIAVSGLTQNTAYDVYVRQDCTGASNGYSTNSVKVSFTTLATPPSNDNICGATALSVSSGTTCTTLLSGQTTLGGTQSLAACAGTADDDVWYSFIATSTSHIITITNSGTGSTNRVHQVFSSSDNTCAGTLTSLNCSDPETSTTTGLTINNTYFVRVHSFGIGNIATFDICVTTAPPPPANDNICGAISLSVSTTTACTTALTGQSTQSATESLPGCLGTADEDIWYSFVATATSEIVTITSSGSGNTDRVHQIFSSSDNTCTGTLTSVKCSDPESSTTAGLTIGDTYFVRVYSYSTGNYATFDICVTKTVLPPPPVNDDASGAIALALGAGCAGNPYDNTSATQSASEPYPSCKGTSGYAGMWYKFEAPASGMVKVSNDGTGSFGDSRMALFSATDANDYATFSIIVCDDDNGVITSNRSIFYAAGLTPGNIYYVLVDLYGSGSTRGTYCVTVDELSSSMLASAAADCSADQGSISGFNAAYTGWISLVDGAGNINANVRQTAGTATTFASSRTIKTGAPRTAGGQTYLNRNFLINGAGATSADVQLFFTDAEAANLGGTISGYNVSRVAGTVCTPNFAGSGTLLTQMANGSANGASFIQVTTPGFSNFFITNSLVVLPIAIDYFRGSKLAGANYLDWKVNCTSAPSVTIILERSADGRNFASIQNQNATATRCLQGFNYTDASPLSGINYYRLKTVTPDGAVRYSVIVALINKDKGFELISVSPNPVKANAVLSISTVKGGRMDVSVTDMTGKVVMKQSLTVIAGNNPVNMNFASLGAGTYNITVINAENEIKATRFVKY